MSWDRNVVVKSKTELSLMREAGKVNAQALKAVGEAIKPGVSTQELDTIAEEIIRKHGGEPVFKGYPGPYPYPAAITASINEELVHGIPGKRTLQNGEIISIDCGTLLGGFVADSAFTMGVGEISPLAARLIDVTEKALYEGIRKMRSGNHTGDISAAIQKYV